MPGYRTGCSRLACADQQILVNLDLLTASTCHAWIMDRVQQAHVGTPAASTYSSAAAKHKQLDQQAACVNMLYQCVHFCAIFIWSVPQLHVSLQSTCYLWAKAGPRSTNTRTGG